MEWDSQTSQHYQVDIEVSGFDRQGLLNEVLQVISDTQTSLSAVSAKGDRRGIASIHIRVGIQNINHLKSVVERVKGVRDIYSVRRIIQ